MQQKITLKLLPSEAANEATIKQLVANTTGRAVSSVTGFHIIKRSIDARARTVWVNLTVNAFIDEPFHQRDIEAFDFKDVNKAQKKVVIVGAGPAGLFAALQLIEEGIQPIILER
jgi:NADPH-dependent 2,4-dienoyl-CoA reductase/sulfur reductase-like enzyme